MTDLFDYAAAHPDEFREAAAGPVHEPCRPAADALPLDLRRVVDILASRSGRDAAITAPDLADAAGLFPDAPPESRGTQLRHLITCHLDDLPFAVVAGDRGFFRPATAAEARRYLANLLARSVGNIDRLAAVVRSFARDPDPAIRAAAIDQVAVDRLLSHLSALSSSVAH